MVLVEGGMSYTMQSGWGIVWEGNVSANVSRGSVWILGRIMYRSNCNWETTLGVAAAICMLTTFFHPH